MMAMWYYMCFLHWLHMAGAVALAIIWVGKRLFFKLCRFNRLSEERGFWKLCKHSICEIHFPKRK